MSGLEDSDLILSSADQDRLSRLQTIRPRGLFTDIDGTISAFAPTPRSATLLPGVAALLTQARQVFDVVAVVSGRRAWDAREMVGVQSLIYIGNHGLECLHGEAPQRVTAVDGANQFADIIGRVMDQVAHDVAPRFPGMLVEKKGITGTIHVRTTTSPDVAICELADFLADNPLAQTLRVIYGAKSVDIRPPIPANKGTAVTNLIEATHLSAAIYFGDDLTDMDAFHALTLLSQDGACHCVNVAVQHAEAPKRLSHEADIVLQSWNQVPPLFAWLIANLT